jgi:ribosomal protein S18 acetylase RimI-like enzyme
MFKPRTVRALPPGLDPDGIKLYTICAHEAPVEIAAFLARLAEVKKARAFGWSDLPGFAILHVGSSALYLVVGWWGNDNELFTSVSVLKPTGWVEDPTRFSFCLWDLEIFWHERNSFVRHLYSGSPDLAGYRADFAAGTGQTGPMSPATVTYLEMLSPADLRPKFSADEAFVIRAVIEPQWQLNKFCFHLVGADWRWFSRASWTDAEWRDYVANPRLRTFTALHGGAVAGYFELWREDDATEIKFFGLAPQFIGRGFGAHLLTVALEEAWRANPRRVWLHTCDWDHPYAQANYLARGMRVSKVERQGHDSHHGSDLPPAAPRLLIRPATPADTYAVSAVLQSAARRLIARGDGMWTLASLAPDCIRPDITCYRIAIVGGVPAGVVKVQTSDLRFWPEMTQGDSLFIHRLAVAPSFAGQGHARALLDDVNSEARLKGMRFVRLDCAADRPKLRRVYEQAGFRNHSDVHVEGHALSRYEYQL